MRQNPNIEKLKTKLFSDNWEEGKEASNQIFEIGGQENINFLIGLLSHSNDSLRNRVALTFRKYKFNEALEPLFLAINNPENQGKIGTLVYALQTLDCKNKLKELFDLVFFGNYEVKSGALQILEKQEFEFSENDLIQIKTKWDNCKLTWDEKNHIDPNEPKSFDLDKDLIQSFVDGYLNYLKKP